MMHAHLHIPRVCVNCQSNSLCVCASGTKNAPQNFIAFSQGQGKIQSVDVEMGKWKREEIGEWGPHKTNSI